MKDVASNTECQQVVDSRVARDKNKKVAEGKRQPWKGFVKFEPQVGAQEQIEKAKKEGEQIRLFKEADDKFLGG